MYCPQLWWQRSTATSPTYHHHSQQCCCCLPPLLLPLLQTNNKQTGPNDDDVVIWAPGNCTISINPSPLVTCDHPSELMVLSVWVMVCDIPNFSSSMAVLGTGPKWKVGNNVMDTCKYIYCLLFRGSPRVHKDMDEVYCTLPCLLQSYLPILIRDCNLKHYWTPLNHHYATCGWVQYPIQHQGADPTKALVPNTFEHL